jgi:hypothetical protein
MFEMFRPWRELLAVYAVIGVAVGALTLLFPGGAKAQDTTPHAHYHDFYKEWMQPGGTLSCCNANKYADDDKMIHESGDCEPTDAELRPTGERRNGRQVLQWYARLPKYLGGEFIPIPDSRIIREKNPDPNRAHLCYAYGRVLCFVPPFGGM